MFDAVPRSRRTGVGSGRSATWLLEERARQHPGREFLVWEPFTGPARVYTYGEIADRSARAAAGFRRRGLARGDRLLIHLQNAPEYLVAWFACLRIGAVAVCTNTRSSLDELSYYVSHSGAVAAVTEPGLTAVVGQAMPDARFVVVTATDGGETPAPGTSPEAADAFDSLVDASDPAVVEPIESWAPASIQYTSGTTGRPKAVVWSHANVVWGAKVNAANQGLGADDRQLAYLPLFHTNSQAYAVLGSLWARSTVVLQPRFSASRFWSTSIRNRCTVCSHIYFALRVLAQQDGPEEPHSYRWWFTGSCDHPAGVKFGVPTVGWWGMTETIAHPIIGELEQPNRPGSMGRAAAEYEIAVLHDDDTPVEPGETGNLLVRGVRGVSLFAEYLHDPEATRDAFDAEGWLRTGDLVTVHDDGFMTFSDRAKDMLKIGAENVAASEIERVVAQVPGIGESAVVGRPHDLLGEVPVVFVVPTAGLDADHEALEEQILVRCREQLADFKVPREVRVIDALPRATLEKVAKHELRKMLADDPDPRVSS